MCIERFTEAQALSDLPVEVFLDTTIHLSRLKGTDLQERVDGILTRFRWKGTASYAKLEYGNIVLSVVSYLLDKIRDLGSLEALRYHVTNRLDPKYRRHRDLQLWTFNLLAHHFGSEEATERAERELRYRMRVGTRVVSALCDETRDNVRCIWADQRGDSRWKSPSKCHLRRPGCRLDHFFVENKEHFRSIRQAIGAMPEAELTLELREIAQVIDLAEKEPESLRIYDNCRKLADGIIAVQGSGYKTFFTQNIRESVVLCRALRQLLLWLHQDPKEPVSSHDYRILPTEGTRRDVHPEKP